MTVEIESQRYTGSYSGTLVGNGTVVCYASPITDILSSGETAYVDEYSGVIAGATASTPSGSPEIRATVYQTQALLNYNVEGNSGSREYENYTRNVVAISSSASHQPFPSDPIDFYVDPTYASDADFFTIEAYAGDVNDDGISFETEWDVTVQVRQML